MRIHSRFGRVRDFYTFRKGFRYEGMVVETEVNKDSFFYWERRVFVDGVFLYR